MALVVLPQPDWRVGELDLLVGKGGEAALDTGLVLGGDGERDGDGGICGSGDADLASVAFSSSSNGLCPLSPCAVPCDWLA